MNAVAEGLNALLDPSIGLCLIIGVLLGTLVGAIPGITAAMAVALAAGFTLTLEPLQGLSVLLSIYVAAQFGDRVPAIPHQHTGNARVDRHDIRWLPPWPSKAAPGLH